MLSYPRSFAFIRGQIRTLFAVTLEPCAGSLDSLLLRPLPIVKLCSGA